MTKKSVYGGAFGREFDTLPDAPDIKEHVKALSAMARRAAQRVTDGDGVGFRKQVSALTDKCEDHLTRMMLAESNGDMDDFGRFGRKLSLTLTELSEVAEKGIADLKEEKDFLAVADKVFKSVVSYEGAASDRMKALSAVEVSRLLDRISGVFTKYLPQKRAAEAFSELMGGYQLPE